MTSGRCEDCQWWRSIAGSSPREGRCVRFPPTVVYTAAATRATVWPRTVGGDGCGEFAAPPATHNPSPATQALRGERG